MTKLTTNDKEKLGEQIIRKYNLWDVLFPDNIGYKKITTKKKQLAGIDYEIYFQDAKEPIYIDLKSCSGPDYSMKPEDYIGGSIITERIPIIPLELRQNGIFTNMHKMTDYFLYIVQDNYETRVTLADFNRVKDICQDNDEIVIKNKNKILEAAGQTLIKPKYTSYRSFNGSGVYIKVPADLFKTFKLEV